MTGQNREDLIICIENAAAFISEEIGYETVSAAFERCGVCDLYQATESELWDVFGDLDFIQNELRSASVQDCPVHEGQPVDK